MVKKMISRFSLLLVLTVLLAACAKQTEYTHVIPSDASFVLSLHLNTLAEKAGLNNKENEGIKQKMTDAFKREMNAAAFQQLEKVLKDPKESGIDVQAPIYYFMSPTYSSTLVAKVGNIDNLKTSVDAMVQEQVCQPLSEKDGYYFTNVAGSVLAFNKTVVLLLDATSTSKREAVTNGLPTLFKQTAENSIAKSVSFEKLQKQKGDIAFFATPDVMSNMYRQLSMGLAPEMPMKDIVVVGDINFEKGKIVSRVETYSENAEVKALLDKQINAMTTVNNTFLKYFPKSTLVFTSLGIKGEAFYNLLSENEDFRNQLSLAKATEIKELFGMFDGNISAGLIDVTMNSVPSFAAYAEVKNDGVLKKLYEKRNELGLKRGEEILQLSDNEYVYKSKNFAIFYGIKDKHMYATNNELIYKSIGKAAEKSVKDTDYASQMKGKSFFMAINAQAILDLPAMKMLKNFGGPYAMYYDVLSRIDYMSMSNEKETMEIGVYLENKDVNALQQIVDLAKQFAGI